ncbi:hypothetical protein PO909_011592 [Leuciscus waleckii]
MTANYLRFLPQYSRTTAPLRQLPKKEEPRNWTAACTEAVRTLKSQLTTLPVLAHFNPDSKTIVTCNASTQALGAVLLQEQDGVERPVAFTSRALTPMEQHYSVGERWFKSDVCVSRGLCTVVPGRASVLSMAHEGHLGIVKLKQRCRDLVWWPGIDHDIEGLVRDCEPCLLSGKTGVPAPTPLQPVPWPSHPWEHLQVDICREIHDHRVPHHQRFLVVVYDLHSEWPEVIPAGTVTSQTITQTLDSLFARWGMPHAITTDNGPQFTFRRLLHLNGGVEKFNQSLKNDIRAHLVQGYTFQTLLNLTLMHYRANQHTTTQASPALLMLGREKIINNNNNNLLHLYSAFLGTQSTLHGRGNLLNHHQCAASTWMMRQQPYCARTPTTHQLTGGEETVMKPNSIWG